MTPKSTHRLAAHLSMASCLGLLDHRQRPVTVVGNLPVPLGLLEEGLLADAIKQHDCHSVAHYRTPEPQLTAEQIKEYHQTSRDNRRLREARKTTNAWKTARGKFRAGAMLTEEEEAFLERYGR